MFSSKSFIVSHVFEFIFVCGARKYSNFIPLHVPAQFSQHNLLKRSSILHCTFLPLLLQINGFQVYVYFWAVYPVSLICVSVLRPVSQCFDFCSFVVQFEMRVSTTPAPFFFLRVALSVEVSQHTPLPSPRQQTFQYQQVGLAQFLYDVIAFSPVTWCIQDLMCALQEWSFYFPESCGIL